MSKRIQAIFAAVWLCAITTGIAIVVTMRVADTGAKWEMTDFDDAGVYVSEEEYEILQRYAKIEEIRGILESQYYTEVDTETLLTGATRGLMDSLNDRYTFYYTPEEMQGMMNNATGEYKGIGVTTTINDDGDIIIIRVHYNTPAQRVGIQVGDYLIAVDGTPVSGHTQKEYDDAIARIAEAGDNTFSLTLQRDGEEYFVHLQRENIVMDRVQYSILEGNIGYVQIADFLGNDVEGFIRAMNQFEKEQITGLIIDLRDNTGGYLDDVVAIADMLLPEGLIVYTEDRAGNRLEERSDASCVNYPITCLVNGNSASASEVLAGALQDYQTGAIIGDTTFGKGIVQTVWTFDDGSGMQLTTATYFTPSGRCIHGTGINPDYMVDDDPETGIDEVLEFARQWLLNGGIEAEG